MSVPLGGQRDGQESTAKELKRINESAKAIFGSRTTSPWCHILPSLSITGNVLSSVLPILTKMETEKKLFVASYQTFDSVSATKVLVSMSATIDAHYALHLFSIHSF